jgi:hypothetical protein
MRGRYGPTPLPIEQRFEKHFIPEPNSGCWLWCASSDPFGYGRLYGKGETTYKAHRVSWEIYNGPIPEGLFVLHKCDVASCVNPRHLYCGTNQDNTNDCCKKKRQAYGERQPGAKLTDAKIIAIRKDPRPQREIATSYGVHQSAIWLVKNGKAWKHL